MGIPISQIAKTYGNKITFPLGVTPCPLHEEVLPSKPLQLCSGGSSSSTFLAAASLSLHYLKSHALVGGCHFLMSSTQGTLAVRVSQLCSVGSKSCTFLAILNSHAFFTYLHEELLLLESLIYMRNSCCWSLFSCALCWSLFSCRNNEVSIGCMY